MDHYQVQGKLLYADIMRTDCVVWLGDEETLFVGTIFYAGDSMLKFVFPRLKISYSVEWDFLEFFTRRVECCHMSSMQVLEEFWKGKDGKGLVISSLDKIIIKASHLDLIDVFISSSNICKHFK